MTTNKFERFVINFCEERNAYTIKDRETNLLVVREDKETTYKTESLKEAYAFCKRINSSSLRGVHRFLPTFSIGKTFYKI